MKPVNFDYERPRHLDEAIALLAGKARMTKVLAGGQSLGPMLNLRLVQPDLLVDITGLAELKRAEKTRDDLVLGACVTHADIEDGRVPDVTGGAMRVVAAGIAYRAVRNRGTIGGSLTHADPSADWVSALAALGAEAVVRGAGGTRNVRSITLSPARWKRSQRRRAARVSSSAGAFVIGAVGISQALPQDGRIRARDRRGAVAIVRAACSGPSSERPSASRWFWRTRAHCSAVQPISRSFDSGAADAMLAIDRHDGRARPANSHGRAARAVRQASGA